MIKILFKNSILTVALESKIKSFIIAYFQNNLLTKNIEHYLIKISLGGVY
jgi:hypothetical protein